MTGVAVLGMVTATFATGVVGVIAPVSSVLKELMGDQIRVSTLVPPGASPHVFEPSPKVTQQLRQATLIVTIDSLGLSVAHSTRLRQLAPRAVVINLDECGLKGDVKVDRQDHGHHHGGQYGDPHFWTSLRSMKSCLPMMAQGLSLQFPKQKVQIQERAKQLAMVFDGYDQRLAKQFRRGQAFVIYHPSLGYLAHDYGLIQLPIEVDGRSPSSMEWRQLWKQASKLGVKTVVIHPRMDPKLVGGLAAKLKAKVVVFDPYAESYPESILSLRF